MLIGLEKRFVFVANSRAASASVERALAAHSEIIVAGTPWRRHMALRDALRAYGFLFDQPGYAPDSFFKFGILRDPVDWIQSWYRHRTGGAVQRPLPAETCFEAFWAAEDWSKWRGPGRRRLQRDLFTAADGTVLVDHIIRYDMLAPGLARICRHLGVPCRLPHRNASRPDPQQAPIPAALRAEIRDFYAEDYALLARLPEINAGAIRKARARGWSPGLRPQAAG